MLCSIVRWEEVSSDCVHFLDKKACLNPVLCRYWDNYPYKKYFCNYIILYKWL